MDLVEVLFARALAGSGKGSDPTEYPLVKTYTAESASTGQFNLTFDKPLKAVRVLIVGIANTDVTAVALATVSLGLGGTRVSQTHRKIMWARIVSNSQVMAYIDTHIDRQMSKLVSYASLGTVAESNGYLNTLQTDVVPCDTGEKIWQLIIKPDTSGGVSVTTGMTIKVYGLEA